MKTIRHLVTLLLLFCCTAVSVWDFSVDAICYTYTDLAKREVCVSTPNKYARSYVIPDSVFYNERYYYVTAVGVYAFSGCSSLKDIKFSAAMTSIDNGAFSGCGFEKLTLPPRLRTISDYAFSNNSALAELHIPSAVETIGNDAFHSCRNLNSVYTYTVEPTTITETTFSSFATANLYVPSTSFWNYYWNNGWSKFDYKKFISFDKPYDYFYLNYDYYLNADGVVNILDIIKVVNISSE